jgi:hypothetical protein
MIRVDALWLLFSNVGPLYAYKVSSKTQESNMPLENSNFIWPDQ